VASGNARAVPVPIVRPEHDPYILLNGDTGKVTDYLRTARLLRAKAADPVVPETERRALLDRAEKLEAKYRKPNSPPTDNTATSTGPPTGPFSYNSTFVYWDFPGPDGKTPPPTDEDLRKYWVVLQDLLKNQWMWNTEYYDKDGNPRPQPDVDDIYEEDYKYDEDDDEDYGYNLFGEEDYDGE
jgi:hypothetical protein